MQHSITCLSECVFAYRDVKEAQMLGERGVLFFFFLSCAASDRGRLRRSFRRHSMRWAVLNPVHCNRTRGGRSGSPAFLQNAVCLHDCHCAGRGALHNCTVR